MEIIKSTNQNGVSKINETLKIKYSLVVKDDKVKSFTGQIIKEDNIVGFCNANANGVVGFSLNEEHGLTNEEQTATIQQFASDITNAFGG